MKTSDRITSGSAESENPRFIPVHAGIASPRPHAQLHEIHQNKANSTLYQNPNFHMKSLIPPQKSILSLQRTVPLCSPNSDKRTGINKHMHTPSRWLGALALIVSTLLTAAAPPPAPQNVRGAWVGTYEFQFPLSQWVPFVQWELATGADSYNVYRADDTNTAWTVAATNVTVPFFLDPFSSFLPSYYFVTAVNLDGESAASNPTTVTEQDGGVITVTPIDTWNWTLSSTSAVVHWITTLAAGDEGIVEWGPSFAGETNYAFYLLNTNYLGGQMFHLTNLTPATVYQYRITSVGATRGGMRWANSFTTLESNRPPVAEDMWYDSLSSRPMARTSRCAATIPIIRPSFPLPSASSIRPPTARSVKSNRAGRCSPPTSITLRRRSPVASIAFNMS